MLRFGTEPNPAYISTLLQEVHSDVSSASLQIMILNEENYKLQLLQQQNDLKGLTIIQLSSFKTGSSCEIVLRSSIKLLSSQSRLIVVVADMKVCKTSQLTFARHVVDSEISELRIRLEEAAGMSTTTDTDAVNNGLPPIVTSLPAIIFLLHIPADQLVMRSCYQTIPLNDWRSTYIDSFHYDKTSATFEESNVIQSSVETTSSSSSLQWMKVAFGLEASISLESVLDEFKNLSQKAFESSIASCNFKQSPRQILGGKRVKAKEFFQLVGITTSEKAYIQNKGNNKDAQTWVSVLFQQRQYFMNAILEGFVGIWSKLLPRIVQNVCSSITMGSTSSGLIECVRSSQKWLITDYMTFLLHKELAANWSLEAISQLPLLADDDDHSDAILLLQSALHDSLVLSANDNIAAAVFAKLMVQIAVTLHLSDDDITLTMSRLSANLLGKVDCSKADKAARTPLYFSFMKAIKKLIPRALSKSRKEKYSSSSAISRDESFLRELISTDPRHYLLAKAISIIELSPSLWFRWLEDFIEITLGFSFHSLSEKKILITIMRNVPQVIQYERDKGMVHYTHSGGIHNENLLL